MILPILRRQAAAGIADSGTTFSRPDFRIYMFNGRPNGAEPGGVAMYQYYLNRGIGIFHNYYNISSGAFNQATMETQVDVVTANPLWDYITLFYCNCENSYYTWGTDGTSGAVRCIPDSEDLYDWALAKFTAEGKPEVQLGMYGSDGGPCGVKRPGSYTAWQYSQASQQLIQADNDACGVSVAPIWDFAIPEAYSSKIYDFCAAVDWYAAEKERLSLSVKLFPLVWPTRTANTFTASMSGTTMTVTAISSGTIRIGQQVYGNNGTNVHFPTNVVSQISGTAGSTGDYEIDYSQSVSSMTMRQDVSLGQEEIEAQLEYAIRIPAVDGIAFWAIDYIHPDTSGGTYLDSQPWMQAVAAFVTKYGLSVGDPY